MMEKTPSSFENEFKTYFQKPVAIEAAAPLKKGALICFAIEGMEPLILTKGALALEVARTSNPEAKDSAHLLFSFSKEVAKEILESPHQTISEIGVSLLKLVVDKKLSFKIQTGFLTLFRYGYFGILTLGGKPIAQFLGKYGFSGVQSFKMLFKKSS